MYVGCVSACTSNAPRENVTIGQPKPVDANGKDGGGNGSQTQQQGSLPIQLEEAKLKSYVVSTASLTYKVSFLERSENGDIKFESGVASINFDKLTPGKKGDLQLDILEGGVLKLQGIIKDLTLRSGVNQAAMSLKPVGGTDASATIGITIAPSTSGAVVPPPTIPGTQPPPVVPGTQPPPTGNPTADGFDKKVKAIMVTHCSECHHAGKALDLTRSDITAQNIDRVIDQLSGSSPKMPPAPRDRVSSGDLDKIKAWKSTGLKP